MPPIRRPIPTGSAISMGQYDFTQSDYRASGYISGQVAVEQATHAESGRSLRLAGADAEDERRHSAPRRRGLRPDRRRQDADPRRLRQGLPVSAARRPADAAATGGDRADARLRYGAGRVARDHGHVPGRSGRTPNATACLNPVAGPTPARRSSARRAGIPLHAAGAVLAGGVVNNTTTGPLVDGDRRMAYTWAFSVGMKREMARTWRCRSTTSATAGRDNTGVDRHQRGAGQSGDRAGSPGWASMCSTRPASWCRRRRAARRSTSSIRSRRPSSARRSTPTSTRSSSGSRSGISSRWSGRVSYTLAHCNDVGVDHRRQQPPARLRPLRSRQHARLRDERQRRHREGAWRRHRVPRVLGLPDQRNGRHRRRTATAPTTTARRRASTT